MRRLAVAVATGAILVLAVFAVGVPMLWPIDEAAADFASANQGPGFGHWFGTDPSGRDLFVLVAKGMRVSLGMSTAVAAISSALGLSVGLAAGMLGGWTDRIGMRIADAMTAMPSLLLAIFLVSLYRGSVVAIVLSLVLTHWISVARVVRAEMLSLRGAEFVLAARLAGLSRLRMAFAHLLPVAAGQTMIGTVLLVAHAIWHESTLSFLGLGLPPHRASLGTLLSDAREAMILGQWWRLVFPAGAIVATTLSLAVLARALSPSRAREAL